MTTVEQRADILAKHKAGASISELSRLHGHIKNKPDQTAKV